MLKQFVKDSMIYGSSGVLTRAISVLLVPFYTRVFTPNDYGVIDFIGIVGAVVAAFVPFEITQAIARFYPDCKEESIARSLTSTAFLFTLGMFSIFLAVALAFAVPITQLIAAGSVSPVVFRVAAGGMAATGLFYFVQNQLRWMLLPKKHAIVSLVFSVTTLLFTVLFVLGFKAGVVGVFWAQIIGSTVGFLMGFKYGRKSYELSFDSTRLKEMLSFSAPIIPSSLGILALGYADRVTITNYLTMTDLGVFGIGYRVASGVGLLMMGFQSAITPIVYYRYAEASAPAELARVFRNFAFVALLGATGLSMFGKEILIILTTPAYYGAVTVIPFLVLAAFVSGMHVFAPGLGIAKKTKHIAVINIIGALLNVTLNILLVPKLGILGAATATLVSSCCVFGSFMMFSQRLFPVPHDFRRLLGGMLVVIILGTAGFSLNGFGLLMSLLMKTIILAACSACLVALRIVSTEELRTYLSKLTLRVN